MKIKGNILVVEDNIKYATKISEILRENNYTVNVVHDPIDGIAEFVKADYDLVISDLKMESMDGVQFLRTIKKINPKIKTIILTANPSDETEIDAIGIEVDRYLVKEIRAEVLLEYVALIIRTNSNLKDSDMIIKKSVSEGIEVKVDSREVLKNGELINLTKKEFDILVYFLDNKNIAISREDFLDEIWTRPAESLDDRIIDVHIKAIRQKTKCQAIVALRGFGYKWVE